MTESEPTVETAPDTDDEIPPPEKGGMWTVIADVYDIYFSGEEIEREDELVDELLTPYISDRSVLDLGCGTARFARRLADEYQSYTGVDISRQMISNAPDLPDTEYVVADIAGGAITGHFGCVMNVFLGAAYTDPDTVWEVTADRLEPGGVFFHMLPTPHFPDRGYYPVDDLDYLKLWEPKEHVRVIPDELSVGSVRLFQPLDGGPLVTPSIDERTSDAHGSRYTYAIITGRRV